MAFRLSKLSRDRLQGVHPDLVRVVERAIQITTQDFPGPGRPAHA
jgi:peptidoglycan L-alanyl-D-glutamate endopeptidase CwlK